MKSVLITGVSRGIGLSIAKEFIQNDYFVFGTSRSKFDLAKALESSNCKHLIVDVNDRDSIASVMKDIPGINNTLDCLVNNAWLQICKDPWDYVEEDFDAIFNVNVKMPYFLSWGTRPLLKASTAEGGGCIVNIGSVH